jgi:hypothetical protein
LAPDANPEPLDTRISIQSPLRRKVIIISSDEEEEALKPKDKGKKHAIADMEMEIA